jgi:plasmid stability protein
LGKATANKAPDFLSRLSGYVDITDLDHGRGKLDPAVTIRRAVRLRMVLKQSAGNLVQSFPGEKNTLHERVNIDANVLRAFLRVRAYKHGARSMEAIVKMSALSGRKRFDPSNLPPAEQLGLHVDAAEFISLLHSKAG